MSDTPDRSHGQLAWHSVCHAAILLRSTSLFPPTLPFASCWMGCFGHFSECHSTWNEWEGMCLVTASMVFFRFIYIYIYIWCDLFFLVRLLLCGSLFSLISKKNERSRKRKPIHTYVLQYRASPFPFSPPLLSCLALVKRYRTKEKDADEFRSQLSVLLLMLSSPSW